MHTESSSQASAQSKLLPAEQSTGGSDQEGCSRVSWNAGERSLEMPPRVWRAWPRRSLTGLWEGPGRAVLLSRLGSVDAEHNSAQLYNTPRHPCVAHGKWRGGALSSSQDLRPGQPKPAASGSTHSRSGTYNPADSSPSRPMGPHRPETGSLNIVPLSPGTTFPHTVTKRQATRLSSLRAGNLPSLLPQLSEQLSLKGGLRGRDRGADSL